MDGRTIPAVTSEQLVFALGVADAAATGKTPQSGIGHLGVEGAPADGVARIGLTDIPANRAMIAVRKQFPSEVFQPLMFRMWALATVMKDSRAKAFLRAAEDDPEGQEVHEAVYEVAATMPLNKDALFNAQKFFRRVAARAREIEALSPPHDSR
jgi:hypothetical protein